MFIVTKNKQWSGECLDTWQNTIRKKQNTMINVSVVQTLGRSWIVNPSLTFWVHYCLIGPSFDALCACVALYISLHVHIVPNALPRSLCGWPRKSLHLLEEGHNCPIVRFAYMCHMICEEFVLLSFLYIKLFELSVQLAFNNRSAVTHHNFNLLKFPFRSSSLNALMLLLCCSFASASFTSRNTTSLSVDSLNSETHTVCRASLTATPSGRLPQKRSWFTKKAVGLKLYSVPQWHFSTGIVNSITCAFSARSSLLQNLENLLVAKACSFLSSMTNLSLLFDFCAVCMLSYRCLQMEWWAAVTVVAIPLQPALLTWPCIFNHQTVSTLTSDLSRCSAQPTPYWLHLTYFG